MFLSLLWLLLLLLLLHGEPCLFQWRRCTCQTSFKMSTRLLPCSTRRLPRSVAMGWLVRRETAISSHHFAFSAHASRASFTYKSTIFSSSPVRGQRQERRCGGGGKCVPPAAAIFPPLNLIVVYGL
ncbi:hypothetical protein LZ32DRAFT_268357 [Colletotrichum eremochloae]|nr:hypothetical protein LZ32DRAFT_268357 [Colletotrichum eremochloae]